MRYPALLRPMSLLVLALVSPLLTGCVFLTDREVQERAKRDQLEANLQADIYEAATAASKGVDLARTTTAIRAAASATIQALGFHYAPAEAWVKSQQPTPTPIIPTAGTP